MPKLNHSVTDAQRDDGQRGQDMYLGRKRDDTLKLGHFRRIEERGYPQRMEGYCRGSVMLVTVGLSPHLYLELGAPPPGD